MKKTYFSKLNRRAVAAVVALVMVASTPVVGFAAPVEQDGSVAYGSGDVDESTTSVTAVDSIEELSRETEAADGSGFVSIDADEGIPSEALATPELEENVRDILSEDGEGEVKADMVADRLEDSGFYTIVGKNEEQIEVASLFATQRLMLVEDFNQDIDAHGAERAVYHDGYYILSYSSQEETKLAFDAFEAEGRTVLADIPLKADSISWGVPAMGLDKEKTKAAKGAVVTVAVLDSGINKSHPIFKGKKIVKPYNFLASNTDVSDTVGHGTAVAGIIAEATPANVRIMPLKVMNSKGTVSTLNMVMALNYAIKNGADMMNMSFVGYASNEAMASWSKEMKKVSSLMICAAGNEGLDMDVNGINSFPAELSNTICVSAMDSSGDSPVFSNYGSSVHFSGPGVNVKVANNKGGYRMEHGTSLATPHVTAAAANIQAMNMNMSSTGIRNKLIAISKDKGPKGRDRFFGYGLPVFNGGTASTPAPQAKVQVKTPYTYTGKPVTPKVIVKIGNKVLRKGADYDISYLSRRIGVGKHRLVVTLKGQYRGTGKVAYNIVKAKNTIKAKGRTIKVRRSKLKKRARSFCRAKVIALSGARGKLSYTKVSGSKKIKVNRKTGAITVARKTRKGKYSVKVRVAAAGNASYKAGQVYAVITVVVK